MSILPTLQNIAGGISSFSQTVSDTLPVVSKAVQTSRDTITTITKGKQPTIPQSQQPATSSELGPGNIGGFAIQPGDFGTILLIGGAILVIWMLAKGVRR